MSAEDPIGLLPQAKLAQAVLRPRLQESELHLPALKGGRVSLGSPRAGAVLGYFTVLPEFQRDTPVLKRARNS